jgi:hypothetical protein
MKNETERNLRYAVAKELQQQFHVQGAEVSVHDKTTHSGDITQPPNYTVTIQFENLSAGEVRTLAVAMSSYFERKAMEDIATQRQLAERELKQAAKSVPEQKQDVLDKMREAKSAALEIPPPQEEEKS